MPRLDSHLWGIGIYIPPETRLLIRPRLTKRKQYHFGVVQHAFNAVRIKTCIFNMGCGENNAMPSTVQTSWRHRTMALFAASRSQMKYTV